MRVSMFAIQWDRPVRSILVSIHASVVAEATFCCLGIDM